MHRKEFELRQRFLAGPVESLIRQCHATRRANRIGGEPSHKGPRPLAGPPPCNQAIQRRKGATPRLARRATHLHALRQSMLEL